MTNLSDVPTLPFLTAKSIANERCAVTMDEDTFVELGWMAFKELGNVAIINYMYKATVGPDGFTRIAANVELIEAVTTMNIPYETLSDSYQLYDSGIPLSRWFFQQEMLNATSRNFSVQATNMVSPGELVGYEWADKEHIVVTNAHLAGSEIFILYKGIMVDDQCLPLLTHKEAMAIGFRVAFYKTERDLFMGKPNAPVILQYVKPESERLLRAASVPEKLNQNQMDNVLDAKTSWDRKGYGRSFKVRLR